MAAKVLFRFFGLLKDAVGSRALVLDVDEGRSVRSVLERLAGENERLARVLESINWDVVVLINGRPASLDDQARGEVTLFPPSAGGSTGPLRAEGVILRKGESLDLNSLVERLASASGDIGAVALFVGVVRGVNMGERVERLEYEYDEKYSQAKLQEIAEEVAGKHGVRVFIAHYVGSLKPGDVTLVVAVAGSRRGEVFPALEEAVERVKHEAPIWKREYRESGKYYILGDKAVRASELGLE
ncbi:molybdenum cofactor biosynthesis protein [Stetteria hydrogenophila]